MRSRKKVQGAAAILLSMGMLAQPLSSLAATAQEAPQVLYTVNCATTDPSVVPEGQTLGTCQSGVDQTVQEDTTGYTWGYQTGESSVLVRQGDDPSSMTGTSWYISDEGEFDEATAGIKYQFQLPQDVQKVEVTVGVLIPQWWDDRTVAIELEGADVGQMSCTDNVLSEQSFTTWVSDGELNFRAKTVDPDNRKADPMLSYLIVKAVDDSTDLEVTQATATTQAQDNEASKAVDGDPDTYWHSSWSGDYPTVEDGLWLTLDLGKTVDDVSQLSYLPRQDKDTNGTYTKYEILVSSDNQSYTKVAEGTWTGDKTEKTATFPAVSARYIRLQAVATKGNSAGEDNRYASAAEVKVLRGAPWDRAQAQQELRAAVEQADAYLKSDHGKTAVELQRLNTMVEQARPLMDESYLAVKEELANLAQEIPAEVTRLQQNLPYQTYDTIFGTDCDGEQYLDNNGNVIQAHGGQIQKWGDTYYWYGEDKSRDYAPVGVHLYTSKDLYNWTDEGVVLRTMDSMEQFDSDPYFSALYGELTEEEQKEIFTHLDANTAVVERPKVIYNESTDQYVLWFHADGPLRSGEGGAHSYWKAEAAVAVSDKPEGPFTLLGSYRLHTREGYTGNQGMARDMNLYVDKGVDANNDGVDDAYIIYSSEENQTMYISRLNADYTYLDKPQGEAVEGVDFTANFVGSSREAPAMFQYDGTYYLMTSGCTGWNPNRAQYATADNPLGPWTVQGDPCVDAGSETTYKSQSTCIVPVDPENGKFMYMGDRWYPPYNLPVGDSRYVWLPVDFSQGGAMVLRDESNWKLEEELGRQPAFYLAQPLEAPTGNLERYVENLPQTTDFLVNGQTKQDVPVTWELQENSVIQCVIQGTIGGEDPLLAGRSFTVRLDVYSKDMEYFFDCNNPQSEYLENLKESGAQVVNQTGDQAYDESQGWGYVGTIGSPNQEDGSTFGQHNGSDVWSSGWFAGPTKPLVYDVKLEAGTYRIHSGYQEWWSASRTMKFSAGVVGQDGSVTELASNNVSINGSTTAQTQTLEIVLDQPAVVRLSVSKVSGGDPVLSWLGVERIPDPTVVTGLEITQLPDKTIYQVGESFDPTGLEVQAVYQDGHKAPCTDWTLSQVDLSTPGEKTVTVTYGEVTAQFTITVLSAPTDTRTLEQLLDKAKDMVAQADKYVQTNWKQLEDAMAAAQDLLNREDPSQNEVEQAAQALLDAILAQRYKADKSILDQIIGKAENLDLTGYTAESVNVFRAALAEAQAVLADETLTQDDQAEVDAAVEKLTAAMDGLMAEEPQPSDKPETTEKPEATDKPESGNVPQTVGDSQATDEPQTTQKPEGVPQTGDASQLTVYVAALACTVLLLSTAVVVRKQTRR